MVLGVPRASFYRHVQQKTECAGGNATHPKTKSRLALSDKERQVVLDTLNSERFVDRSPAAVYMMLLEENIYLCSIRTMYRILNSADEVRERRCQRRSVNYKKPELLATAPNQVWSWDITRLKGPTKWTYFYLYVLMDIFSRYVVGWLVASNESQSLAKQLIDTAIKRQAIMPNTLTIHSDRGRVMTSKTVALLMTDLGVTKTHNRPYTSNDNPYSESQFKTIKYCPEFPGRFGGAEDARLTSGKLLDWYNTEHRHSGLCYCTPESVHYGNAPDLLKKRNMTLKNAFDLRPDRFHHRLPVVQTLPQNAWINKPEQTNIVLA